VFFDTGQLFGQFGTRRHNVADIIRQQFGLLPNLDCLLLYPFPGNLVRRGSLCIDYQSLKAYRSKSQEFTTYLNDFSDLNSSTSCCNSGGTVTDNTDDSLK